MRDTFKNSVWHAIGGHNEAVVLVMKLIAVGLSQEIDRLQLIWGQQIKRPAMPWLMQQHASGTRAVL